MRYNQTITFQSNTPTYSGGSKVDSWANVTGLVDIPCLIDDVNSFQKILAERNGHQLDKLIYCDYNSSITKDMRIVWGGENYRITNVRNPNQLNRHLEISVYNHE